MLVHSRLLVFCGVLFLFCFSPVYGQTRIRVKVSWAEHGNSGSEAIIRSALGRELRALGDVVVVESDPNYTISVVGIDLETVGGHVTGYAMSYVVVGWFPVDVLQFFIPDTSFRSAMTDLLAGYGRKLDHQLLSGSSVSGDMQSACKGVIAEFDVQTLQPARDLLDRMRRMRRSTPAN